MKFIKKAKRGFTLVELVVVIAVIAILAAVSVGAYFGVTDSANNSKLEQEAKVVHTNIQLVGSVGNDNQNLNKNGLFVKDLDIFESELNAMSGSTYDVVISEPESISNPTVYLFNSSVTNGANLVNTRYDSFGYYTPTVGGKRASVNIPTGDIEITKLDFEVENNPSTTVPDAPTTDVPPVATEPTVTPSVHEHTFANTYTHDETHHWYASTCGHDEEVRKVEHDFDDEVIESSCDTDGYTRHTCKDCGYYFDDETVLAAHTLVDDEKVPATCTEPGKEAGKHCTKCDYTEGGETIPALDHDLGDWIVDSQATCTSEGEHHKECSRCDYEETEIINKKDHIEDVETKEDYVEPTCTEPGSYNMVVRCKDCKEIIKTTSHTIPASHTLVDDAKVEPTCTEPGKEAGKHCTKCEYTEGGAAISALGHRTYLNGKCTSCDESKVIYLDASVWDPSSCRLEAYFFDNGTEFVTMTKVTDKIFKVTVPKKGYPKIIFCRMNPSASEGAWTSRWNQTGNLTIPTDSKNYIKITGWDDNQTPNWSTYTE